MKKFMITGMVFLTAMTVLAGCGNATETTTTEEISTADENQEISVSSGGNLTIPVDELTENAAFYSVNVDGTEMEVMAVKTSDGPSVPLLIPARSVMIPEMAIINRKGAYQS